jgi:DNA-binding GntR family transcriptional regulator
MSIRPTTERGRLYKTTQAMVAGELREGILSGVLKGGQPLRQTEIAERFRVSRILAREALRQLEGEGLISFYPTPGWSSPSSPTSWRARSPSFGSRWKPCRSAR